ncbi:MAG: hypothetical protein ACYTG5_13025 [Planctomycetota bacterium]|jgi:hypothetical protein
MRAKTDQLATDLAAYRFKGPLAQAIREFKLERVHFQVLATLLQRHLRSDSPAMEGRNVLAAITGDSFEMLSRMDLLREDSPLRSSGLVVVEDDEDCAEDILEARFRISEDALSAFRDEIEGLVVEDKRSVKKGGYANNREYLLDLRILHNLYKHRSERIFHQDRWDRVHAGGERIAGNNLSKRIESYWRKITKRLRASEDLSTFPALRFFREHNLLEQEVVMVIHLLFKELYEGSAYADAVDLLHLVSASEEDLLRFRGILRPGGNLLSSEILKLEPMLEGRELTGEVHLADWVVNRLFGAAASEQSIDRDEQLDWHFYLKNLEDTQSFYRDLETN